MRLSHLLLILCLEQQFIVFQFFNKIIKKQQQQFHFYYAEHTLLKIGTLVYKRVVMDR